MVKYTHIQWLKNVCSVGWKPYQYYLCNNIANHLHILCQFQLLVYVLQAPKVSIKALYFYEACTVISFMNLMRITHHFPQYTSHIIVDGCMGNQYIVAKASVLTSADCQ